MATWCLLSNLFGHLNYGSSWQLGTSKISRGWCCEYGFKETHSSVSANALLLDVYSEVLGGQNDLRWRIEHAQVVSPEDRPKFEKFSIIPSVQPTHAISDGPWAEDRLGAERIANAYAYEDLRKTLGLLALGTDFPVEGIDPLETFRAAVLRTDRSGEPQGGYQPKPHYRNGCQTGRLVNSIATFSKLKWQHGGGNSGSSYLIAIY